MQNKENIQQYLFGLLRKNTLSEAIGLFEFNENLVSSFPGYAAYCYACWHQFNKCNEIIEKEYNEKSEEPLEHYLFAQCFYAKREVEKAEQTLNRALMLANNYVDAIFLKSTCKLLNEEFSEGFKLYEARFGIFDSVLIPEVDIAIWQGQAIDNKVILVTTEQGHGDIIQFLRFLPYLKTKGAKGIILHVSKNLEKLISSLDLAEVITDLKGVEADYWIPLLSIPSRISINEDDLKSYIKSNLIHHKKYNTECARTEIAQLKGHKNIGLIWSGNKYPSDRSFPINLLAPLILKESRQLYSLQYGLEPDSCDQLVVENFMTDLANTHGDFYNVSLAMDQMDLIICCDTYAAHLAGSFGIQTLLIINGNGDWRWGKSNTSVWYDSITITRKDFHRGWLGFFHKVVVSQVEQMLND